MAISPRVRKFNLTVHIILAVGWLGAVACFLVLAVTGLTSNDTQLAPASYISMNQITVFLIIPFSFATLLTGLIQSLGTKWGLFRHYWVQFLFLLTSFSLAALLVHLQPISHMANIASGSFPDDNVIRGAQVQLVMAPAAALLVLLASTFLAVYKPKGLTRYGQRKLTSKKIPRIEL